ncbi:uncharacterized protein LOC105701906 [Orussus abietinus]|uniref:uncharacterized protein LOC105701906 n=1 Tax=Orussus abietinus TaxID=222816 RepID=UPI00062613D4|nr:uncharacterized protein LOC105701906 [Orussus abietinus]
MGGIIKTNTSSLPSMQSSPRGETADTAESPNLAAEPPLVTTVGRAELPDELQATLRNAHPGPFHTPIQIEGQSLEALVDCGTSKSFLRPGTIELVTRLALPTFTVPPRRVLVADGHERIIDTASVLEVRLQGRTVRASFFWMPACIQTCVLGLDFLRAAQMVIDFAIDTWYFRSAPETKHIFTPTLIASGILMCNGLQTLETDQQHRLQAFLNDVLPESSTRPGQTELTKHRIEIIDSAPVRQKHYSVTPVILESMWKEVDTMFEDDIIEPCQSEWASPGVMVKKPNGKWRFCIDFWKVHAVTKKDAYLLPNMTTILDQLRQANYITTLDLSQAYFEI